jgi:predicted permease
VYALIHRVLLRPLPYADPGRLVWLDHVAPGFGFDDGIGMTPWLYVRYDEASDLLDGIALAQWGRATLTDGTEAPERVARGTATASTAAVLGVGPVAGRWFEPDESGAVVLSHGLWQRRYGGDTRVIGRIVRLDGVEREIIGIMPATFRFPEAGTEVWTNQEYTIAYPDGGFNYVAVGRMSDGVTLTALQTELQALIQTAAAEYGDHRGIHERVTQGRIEARPLGFRDHVAGDIRSTLWMLLGAVGLVLAAAWANVANLFVVRSESRGREVAVRRAMGAGRSQIARLFVAEGFLLSIAAWLLAIGIATVAIRVIVHYSPLDLPRASEISMDGHIVLLTLITAILAGLGLTIIPLLSGGGDAAALRDGSRSATASRGRLRLRSALMAAQVALAVMLVAGAGLLVRSWQHVRAADPGFAARSVLFFDVGLTPADHPTRESAASFHERMRDRLEGLPRVRTASFATCLPLHGYCWGDSVVPDSDPGGTSPVIVSMRRVSTAFFETLELPLTQGRAFTDADVAARSNVVVLSEATARRLFPEGNAVGRRVALGGGAAEGQQYTVIGIARDAATESVVETESELVFYMPMRDAQDGSVSIHYVSFLVATEGDPSSLLPGIRALVQELDPNLAIANIRTLESVLAGDRASIAFTTVLLLVAALVALVLGAFGIYAVVAWVVGRRTAEIGLRLALGARAPDVMVIVFRQAGNATAIGLLVGLLSAALLARVLSSLLFGVEPIDATVFGLAAFVLVIVAASAAAVPARRAWRLRPSEALRVE